MMKIRSVFNNRGLTLIELLIVLLVGGIIVAGIYRVFVAQSKAYIVQDQVVEVQQNIRVATEVLMKDLRMAGYDNNSVNSLIKIAVPVVAGDHSITVNYEYDNTTQYTVTYRRDAASSRLMRQLTTTKDDGTTTPGAEEPLLENVDAFDLAYGVDQDDNGKMDDLNGNGVIDAGDWLSAANVGTMKVIAVRLTLTARPDQTNQDVKKWVSPRTLTTVVSLKNLSLIQLTN
jgi:prepilin-type N-terminal cleavage/methylation domain-containing protein